MPRVNLRSGSLACLPTGRLRERFFAGLPFGATQGKKPCASTDPSSSEGLLHFASFGSSDVLPPKPMNGSTNIDTSALVNLAAGALTLGAVLIQILNARL